MFVREIMEASKDELDVVQSSQEPQSRVGGELHSIVSCAGGRGVKAGAAWRHKLGLGQ